MGFREIVGRIEEFEGDAIINSLGVDMTDYGRICSSIVSAAQSKELTKIFKEMNGYYVVGECFVTSGYNLPAKHIVHVITTRKKEDRRATILKFALLNALEECYKQKLYNIGVPRIGTGANGHSSNTVDRIVASVCKKYCKKNPMMTITYVKPSLETSEESHRILANSKSNGNYHTKREELDFKNWTKYINKYFKDRFPYFETYGETKGGYKKDPNSITLDDEEKYEIHNIGEYIDAYIAKKYKKDAPQVFIKRVMNRIYGFLAFGTKRNKKVNYVGSQRYYEIKKCTHLDRNTFYKLILALEMTKKESQDFLNFFGFSFFDNNLDEKDTIIQKLIYDKKFDLFYIKTFFESKKDSVEPLFIPKKR